MKGTLLKAYIAIVKGSSCGVPSSQRMRLPLMKHCMGVREEHIGCEFQVLTATSYMFERIECIAGNDHWDWESYFTLERPLTVQKDTLQGTQHSTRNKAYRDTYIIILIDIRLLFPE